MRSGVLFLPSAALTVVAFAAAVLLHPDWDAAAAVLAAIAGMACLTSLIALEAAGERRAPSDPGARSI